MLIYVMAFLMELFKDVQRKLTVTTGKRTGVYQSYVVLYFEECVT